MFFVIITYRDVIEKYRSKELVSRVILNLTARSRCGTLIVTIKRFAAAKITEMGEIALQKSQKLAKKLCKNHRKAVFCFFCGYTHSGSVKIMEKD